MEKQSSGSPEPIKEEVQEKLGENLSTTVDIGELRRQLQLSQKRENLATLRLAVKEKQLRDLMDENESMKRNSNEQNKADCTLVDHAVGVMFTAMRDEIRRARKNARLAALELRAVKNGSECNDAKELTVMCKKLERENGELKEGLSRVTRLETLLAYSRKTTEGLRKRCRDFDEILAERDEEIKRLQVELARAHEENTRLKRTNLNGIDTSMTPEDNPVSEQNVWQNAQNAGVSNTNTENNMEEVVSVSSPELAHDDVEGDDDVERVVTSGANGAAEAVSVSSPESTQGAPEAETISSDEQEAGEASSSNEFPFIGVRGI